jgi:hypothetical protein
VAAPGASAQRVSLAFQLRGHPGSVVDPPALLHKAGVEVLGRCSRLPMLCSTCLPAFAEQKPLTARHCVLGEGNTLHLGCKWGIAAPPLLERWWLVHAGEFVALYGVVSACTMHAARWQAAGLWQQAHSHTAVRLPALPNNRLWLLPLLNGGPPCSRMRGQPGPSACVLLLWMCQQHQCGSMHQCLH